MMASKVLEIMKSESFDEICNLMSRKVHDDYYNKVKFLVYSQQEKRTHTLNREHFNFLSEHTTGYNAFQQIIQYDQPASGSADMAAQFLSEHLPEALLERALKTIHARNEKTGKSLRVNYGFVYYFVHVVRCVCVYVVCVCVLCMLCVFCVCCVYFVYVCILCVVIQTPRKQVLKNESVAEKRFYNLCLNISH